VEGDDDALDYVGCLAALKEARLQQHLARLSSKDTAVVAPGMHGAVGARGPQNAAAGPVPTAARVPAVALWPGTMQPLATEAVQHSELPLGAHPVLIAPGSQMPPGSQMSQMEVVRLMQPASQMLQGNQMLQGSQPSSQVQQVGQMPPGGQVQPGRAISVGGHQM
jgi:hypothetical protein